MCTILVLHRVHPTVPVVVAANRDEFFDREALPPELRGRTERGDRIVAGRDVRGGGTWLGATSGGVFAAITNQRSWELPQPRSVSRGSIVGDALASGSVAGIDALLDALEPGRTLPFNLIYGDVQRLVVAYGRDEGIERVELGSGIHVLANDRIGSLDMPKAGWLIERVRPLAQHDWPTLRSVLETLLGDDTVPEPGLVPPPPPGAHIDASLARRLQALNIRTPRYGTVSATLLALGDGDVLEHRYADGPPADVSFRDVTALYREP